MYSRAYYTREQLFNDRFPLSIVAILAIVQMLATFAIIAFEVGHIVISLRWTNLFVGFWTAIPFTILWISMFATVCCCRRRSCATHAVVENFISLLFAIALIVLNALFIREPYKCFFTNGICRNLSWMNDINLTYECFNGITVDCHNTRIALIKAQLAAGAVLAATCLIYIIIYATVAHRVSRAERHPVPTTHDAAMAPVYHAPVTSAVNYQHQPYANPTHGYQPSAPVMMPAYQQLTPVNSNGNYTAMYPQIPSERF